MNVRFIFVRGTMRRANAHLQADRRFEILEAAQTCFARSGFHQTSMQEICTEAGMSPGNLYRYFRSKEEIIAGIAERDRGAGAGTSPGNLYRYFRAKEEITAGTAERDRAAAAEQFAAVGNGNFFDGLAALARDPLGGRSAGGGAPSGGRV